MRRPRDWWEVFGDAELSKYMRECAESNPDLKSLFFRVEQARENAGIKRGALYPHAGVSGDWFRTEVGDRSILRPLGSRFEDWAVGATLTWDADLFGRIRSVLLPPAPTLRRRKTSTKARCFRCARSLLRCTFHCASSRPRKFCSKRRWKSASPKRASCATDSKCDRDGVGPATRD